MAPSKPKTHTVYAPGQWDTLTDEQRHELKQWLRSNGINPDDVPIHEPITIETADGQEHIHYVVYLRDETGHRYVDPDDPDQAAQEKRAMPLVDEPLGIGPEFAQATDGTLAGTWTWRCNGVRNCEGAVGMGYDSKGLAMLGYVDHSVREHGRSVAR